MRNSINLLIYLFIALVIVSCAKDDATIQLAEDTTTSESVIATVLGEKLENPYSVENMKIAYDSLTSGSSIKSLSSVSITTTDYYVRFYLESDEQFEELDADSLVLFPYPLDYEIETYGDDYDQIDSSGGKWMYTSVPVDYDFRSDIEYEILEDLYLPESVEETSGTVTKSVSNKLALLEEKSLQLTGNADESDSMSISTFSTISTLSKKKRPTGYVYVENTETGEDDPVVGMKIRFRHWFKYGVAHTTSTGYYSSSTKYRNNPTYIFIFKNKEGFQIRAKITSIERASSTMGKYSKSGHDFYVTQSSDTWRFCTVNNAIVKYFDYCDDMGIGSPDDDLRIAALDKSSGGSAAPMLKHINGSITVYTVKNFLGGSLNISVSSSVVTTILKVFAPDIIIKAASSRGTAKIHEVTFHELTHAGHYNKVGDTFWKKYIAYICTNYINGDGTYGDGTGTNAGLCALAEAWAYNMGYYLTIQEFGTGNSVMNKNVFEKFEPKSVGDSDDDIGTESTYWYGWIPAGIMNDLVDSKVDEIRSSRSCTYYDNVSGYSYEELFDALDKDVTTPQKFRDRLLSENDDLDEDDVNDLFEAYYCD